MADVLGKYSFLDTPDVNGSLVLLETNPVMNGTGSLTLPAGTTAQRPGSPVAGMVRFNTTMSSTEFYSGTAWIPAGNVIQMVVGNIPAATTNSVIPYDNTTPQSNEGVQLWSRSFTPILSNSTILITSTGWATLGTASDRWVTLATFNGTTCFSAILAIFSTTTGEGNGFSLTSLQISGSTSARTYSARMGSNNSTGTLNVNRGNGGENYGGANEGTYIIQEIAP